LSSALHPDRQALPTIFIDDVQRAECPAIVGTMVHEVIEAVIRHCKTDGHLGRNFMKGRHCDQISAVMSAVGYNVRLILKWLRLIVGKIIAATWNAMMPNAALATAY
jgi:IS5 family transposase